MFRSRSSVTKISYYVLLNKEVEFVQEFRSLSFCRSRVTVTPEKKEAIVSNSFKHVLKPGAKKMAKKI